MARSRSGPYVVLVQVYHEPRKHVKPLGTISPDEFSAAGRRGKEERGKASPKDML